ncbi:fungal-specific transcription factor domain-containing protein [Xylariales sp. PMI_506]|nr:fungal-specific transcription factor domain-containing protein [Xylariales sp. PMI_506]
MVQTDVKQGSRSGGRRRKVSNSTTTVRPAERCNLRSRSFTGCRTCRNRHMKCDETRPVCSTCQRLGLACEGYEARLFWAPDRIEKDSHRASTYRYPLFSEEERYSMSLELVESVGKRSAEAVLLDLDVESPPDFEGYSSIGPFGVFRGFLAPPKSTGALSDVEISPPPSSASSLSKPSLEAINEFIDENIEAIPESSGSLHSNFEKSASGQLDTDLLEIQWENTESADPSDLTSLAIPWLDLISVPKSPHFMFDLDLDGLVDGIDDPQDHDPPTDPEATSDLASGAVVNSNYFQPPVGLYNMDVSTSSIPAHAECLLRYYREGVLSPVSPSNGKRTSPWQLYLLPCALETFAELCLWNTTSHARHSILYSLLSNSAFHLGRSVKGPSGETKWREVAIRHQDDAKIHLQKALQAELGSGDETQYSEILMAILAMAMVYVFHDPHTVSIFLLDAERLIRLRGLPNPKTFKNRVLHHMYTHLRLMNESLSISTVDTSTEGGQLSLRNTQQSFELRKFRVSEDCLATEFDLTQTKPEEIAYSDLHLEVPGKWAATLYPEMYGIPESLMTLFSRTISLANEKARLDSIQSDSALAKPASHTLSHHIQTLEQKIWSWNPPCSSTGNLLDHISKEREYLPAEHHTQSMVLALHQALILYFYRRLYDRISAMILQRSVEVTLGHLEACMEANVEGQDFATTIAWSLFIASCEAVTPELQERSRRCLRVFDERGMFFGTSRPSEMSFAIWEKREQTRDWSLSWPDLRECTV